MQPLEYMQLFEPLLRTASKVRGIIENIQDDDIIHIIRFS